MILKTARRLTFSLSLIFLSLPTWATNGFWEVTAHRGNRLSYRENSKSALIDAMDIGAASVEFDVHLTKDSVPIIYHDYKLKPADFNDLSEPVLIKDLTWQEIQQMRYSDRLITRPGDVRLISFKELLMLVKNRERSGQPTIPLHLEIKSEKDFLDDSSPIAELALQISKVIDQVPLKTPIIARAFNWDVLREFKTHQPKVPLILLVDNGEWATINFPAAIAEFHPVGFAPNHADLTSESIAYLTARGIDVNPWTVNDPEIADRLLQIGVTGITTDHPSTFMIRYRAQLLRQACLRYYN